MVTKLDAVEATKAELACRGIALSPHFHFISVWVGRNIWFFSTRLQDLKLLKLNDGGNHSKLCCLDVRFSACQSVAVALWGTDPSQTADSKHSEGKELSIYMLSDKEVLKTASISVECQPRSYCFLPDPAVRLLAVTTLQGLQLFTYDDTGIPKLVLELSESQINDKMKISKTPNGPSSPQSTAHTEVALGDHGRFSPIERTSV